MAMVPASYDPTASSEESLPSVPCSEHEIVSGLTFFPPRTRHGYGPGIITIHTPIPADVNQRPLRAIDPPLPIKLAEEGYGVVRAMIGDAASTLSVEEALRSSIETLQKQEKVDNKDKFAVLVYGPDQRVLETTISLLPQYPQLCCAVAYDCYTSTTSVPLLSHLPAPTAANCLAEKDSSVHVYSDTASFFYEPHLETYHPNASAVSYTRTINFLRKHLDGPHFDLEAIWEEHCKYEFAERSLAKTMGTMVEEPYVNHIPTMTGGIGRDDLTAFYRDHFIFKNPHDTRIEVVSRTVGVDRVVDEFVFHFTHDCSVDWLFPGLAPTGKKLAIPMLAVVNIRGDRLAHEHIHWDQATALVQAGLLPLRVAQAGSAHGETLRLPVAGVEATRLFVDERDGQSNLMLRDTWK